jgi:hypothetical protein
LSSDGGQWRAGAPFSFRAGRRGSGASPLNEGFGRERPMSGPDPRCEVAVGGAAGVRHRGRAGPGASRTPQRRRALQRRWQRDAAAPRFGADTLWSRRLQSGLSDVEVSSFERLIVKEPTRPDPSFFVAARDDGNGRDTYDGIRGGGLRRQPQEASAGSVRRKRP